MTAAIEMVKDPLFLLGFEIHFMWTLFHLCMWMQVGRCK